MPDELIEAARVDGASHDPHVLDGRRASLRDPAAAMLVPVHLRRRVDQFFWPFIVLDRQSPTLPVALSLLQADYFVDYSIVLAGVLLARFRSCPVRLRRQAARQRHHGRRGQGLSMTIRHQRGLCPHARQPRARSRGLPVRRGHGRVPDRGRRPRGRPHRLDLGRLLPRARRRRSTPTTATSRATTTTVPRRRRADEVDWGCRPTASRPRGRGCAPTAARVNPKGVDFYKRLVDELLDADILPWLTLYHWDLPQALRSRAAGPTATPPTGSPSTRSTCTTRSATGSNVWTTLNEPWCSSFLGYTAGVHAPGHTAPSRGPRWPRTTCCSATARRCGSCARATRRSTSASRSTSPSPTRSIRPTRPTSTPPGASTASSTAGSSTRSSAAQYPADIFEDIRAMDALRGRDPCPATSRSSRRRSTRSA